MTGKEWSDYIGSCSIYRVYFIRGVRVKPVFVRRSGTESVLRNGVFRVKIMEEAFLKENCLEPYEQLQQQDGEEPVRLMDISTINILQQ